MIRSLHRSIENKRIFINNKNNSYSQLDISVISQNNQIHKSLIKYTTTIKKYYPSTSLTTILSYNYLSPIDKPIQSISLNSIIQLSTQFMTFSFDQWTLPAELSIVLGGICFRILVEIVTKFFQQLKLKDQKSRTITKIVNKVFIVDLTRDVSFYNLDHRTSYLMHQYYKAGYLTKNMLTSYLNLSFLRGCHHLLCQQSPFLLHTFLFPSLNSHDPTFLLPLIPMFIVYLILTKSHHPFLIHLIRKQNLLYRVNFSFMIGLICVPIPVGYQLGLVGLGLGHLIVRAITNYKNDVIQQYRNLAGQNLKFNQQKSNLIRNHNIQSKLTQSNSQQNKPQKKNIKPK